MYGLRRNKVIILLILSALTSTLNAQHIVNPNRERPFHFGFSLYGIQAKMKTITSENFYLQDSIDQIITKGQPGFGFGGIFEAKLNKSFSIRVLPGLTLAERSMTYVLRNGRSVKMNPIETTSFDVPILIKYRSQRIINTRAYVIAGIRYYHDFASDHDVPRGPQKKLIALKKSGYNYEFGFGLDINLDYFKFCPEIKMSNSLKNMHSKDSYLYSGQLSGLYPRMFVISLNFETS